MSTFHLAGVVPLAAPALDFDMPWHDSLMPIGKGYLAVERSILECAYAGCETIWVVCDDSVQPLIRKKIGDYVQDPVWINRKYEKFKNNFRKRIPIYYVPTSVHDRGHRDSLGWSALHGAYTANKISKSISKKLSPSMFYISFPYGVYDVRPLKPLRKEISSTEETFLSYDERTVIDGEYLGFTISWETVRELRSEVWKKTKENNSLSVTEKYNIRELKLNDIFGKLVARNKINISEYHRVDSWHDYCKYLNSEFGGTSSPNPLLLKGYKSRGIDYKDP